MDTVMFVLGLLMLGIIVLMLIDNSDAKMDATPIETYTIIPDPFAPVTREPKHLDYYRATDTPYVAMRFFDPAHYGERTTAKVKRQADAFELLSKNWRR